MTKMPTFFTRSALTVKGERWHFAFKKPPCRQPGRLLCQALAFVVVLILIFPTRLDIAAAAWAILAFGEWPSARTC